MSPVKQSNIEPARFAYLNELVNNSRIELAIFAYLHEALRDA